MAVKDELCSAAAVYMGDNPISDVENETGAAPEALNAVYDQIYKSICSCYMWSFATKIEEITTPVAWVVSTTYSVGDYVSNDSENYRCIATHGEDWVTATAYTAGEYIENNDVIYICILAHTSSIAGAVGNEPGVGDDTATYWTAVGATSTTEPGDGANTATFWALSFLSGSSYNHTYYSTEMVMPSDVLKLWAVYPLGTRYEIVSDGYATSPKDLILSQQTELSLKYTYEYSGNAPESFNKAVSYGLASSVALAVTEDMGTKQIMDQEYKMALAMAKNENAQGKRSVALVSSPFTDIR